MYGYIIIANAQTSEGINFHKKTTTEYLTYA